MIEIVVLYESDLARCTAEFSKRNVYLHLRFRRWGMDAARELRVLWPEIKAMLKRIGHDVIYVYNKERDTDEKWMRFVRTLGFREVARGKGLVIMGVSNA